MLTEILQGMHYVVQQGAFAYVTADQCKEMSSCFGNNPASPYGFVFLPAGPHEDTLAHPSWGTFVDTPIMTIDLVRMSSRYRLEKNETVIIFGQTPPRCLYYSYVPYIYDRWYPYGWTSPSTQVSGKCSDVTYEDVSRCEIFASLGNPINMLTMNTSNTNGESFNSAFAHFMGGDAEQVAALTIIADLYANVPFSIQNIFPLSTEKLNLGVSSIRYCSATMLHMHRCQASYHLN